MKNNIAQRAIDIADREAKIIYNKTHNFEEYLTCWLHTYQSVLREFHDGW